MDKKRQECIDEINRIKNALDKTNSKYLKRDYGKALKRLNRKLRQYES